MSKFEVCNFCGLDSYHVQYLIKSLDEKTHICGGCVFVCCEILPNVIISPLVSICIGEMK